MGHFIMFRLWVEYYRCTYRKRPVNGTKAKQRARSTWALGYWEGESVHYTSLIMELSINVVLFSKKVIEYDQEIPHSQTADNPMAS